MGLGHLGVSKVSKGLARVSFFESKGLLTLLTLLGKNGSNLCAYQFHYLLLKKG